MTVRVLAAILVAALLTDCGGGGSGVGGGGPTVAQIQTLTRLAAPVEIALAQVVRAPAIVSNSDSLVLSSLHGETSNPSVPTFRLASRCSGDSCVVTNTITGQAVSFSLHSLEFDEGGASQPIGTAHGVTLMWETGEDADALGAWMDHSGFAVQMEAFAIEDVDVDARYSIAGGDLTGTAPNGSATLPGLMVGAPVTGSARRDRLAGTAAFNYDVSLGTLDAGFSSIKNIDRGRPHSTETVLFQDKRTARSKPT